MELRHTQKKMDNCIYMYMCIYVTVFYIFVMVTTHQRFRSEGYNNVKQEEPEAKPTKADQNKENRNTRSRKQWKNQATRKQKVK